MLFLHAGNEEHSCEFGSMKYYALCGFGGILSCGLTHTAVVPLDLVKCRIQVKSSYSIDSDYTECTVRIVFTQVSKLLSLLFTIDSTCVQLFFVCVH